MIWESCYWKEPLLKLADKIVRWQRKKNWSEQVLVNIEREIFIAFYSIRKLMEAHKLSDSTENTRINVYLYPNIGRDVTYMNWYKLELLYDFSSRKAQTRDLRFICNQIIHSYVFTVNILETGIFYSLFFCSDRERNNQLYELEIPELLNIFRTVGRDYPASGEYTLDPVKQDYIISQQ